MTTGADKDAEDQLDRMSAEEIESLKGRSREDPQSLTLAEVAILFEMTRRKIHTIEERALSKLAPLWQKSKK